MTLARANTDLDAYELGARDERDRIARELNDEVIHALFAVGLSLMGIVGEASNQHVERRLLDAVDDLDRAIHSLRERIYRGP